MGVFNINNGWDYQLSNYWSRWSLSNFLDMNHIYHLNRDGIHNYQIGYSWFYISLYSISHYIYIYISHVHVEIPRFHGSIFNPNIYRAYVSSCINTTSPTPATHLPPAAAGSARRSACSPRARCARVATTDRLMGAGNVFGTVGRAVFFLNDTGPGMLLKKLRTWHKHPEKPGSRVIFTCEI